MPFIFSIVVSVADGVIIFPQLPDEIPWEWAIKLGNSLSTPGGATMDEPQLFTSTKNQ